MTRPAMTVSRTCRMASAVALILAAACEGAGDSTPLDRSQPPELSPPANLVLPPVVEKTLPNGLQILMVEHHELPVVNFIMLVGAGPETDADNKLGLATLTASLLDEGAGNRDALAIADQAAFLGASLSTSSS